MDLENQLETPHEEASSSISPTSEAVNGEIKAVLEEDGSPKKRSPSKNEIDVAQEALNHLVQGKRHLLVVDIPSAVASLEKACQLLSSCYGEFGIECADAYYHYGRALLEMARIETGVLGEGIDNNEETVDDQEASDEAEGDDDDDNDDENADEEGGQDGAEKVSSTENGLMEHDSKAEDNEAESADGPKVEESDKIEGDAKADETVEAESEADATNNASESDDVPPLQLAWEVLDLSKVILQRKLESSPSDHYVLKLADVHLKLGEVGTESDNHDGAVADFNECLRLQESVLKPDNRCLAETHYQLGLALSYNNDFDKSVDEFKKASYVLELRLKTLKGRIENRGDGNGEGTCSSSTEPQPARNHSPVRDAFYSEEKEIEEITGLLPDITDKIRDMGERLVELKSQLSMSIKSTVGGSDSSSSSLSATTSENGFAKAGDVGEHSVAAANSNGTLNEKPITNICHLVKRKRPVEEVVTAEAEGSESKRLKPTEAGSGDVEMKTESNCNEALPAAVDADITDVAEK